MISTPLRMENPVRRPIVPPIKPNWASIVTLKYGRNVLAQIDKRHVYLFIPLNLIIGGCVKVYVH